MRAVSVSITAETGISGLVFPGDRVDLIVAQSFRQSSSETALMRRASETVLSDIRVLAIDQNIKDKNEKPAVGKTVTFEVTPKQAEVIAVASELGKLSLSLRALALSEDSETDRPAPTWDIDVSRVAKRGGGATEEISVFRGSKFEAVPIRAGAASPAVSRGAQP
jgi:pilus assembly protein CpaB